jgi:ribosomal protein S18 acetylase RimI-like enzyme
MLPVDIILYQDPVHRNSVIALWRTVFGYETAHNDPEFVIDSKLSVHDGLFFVAVSESKVVGTIMAGYDGHRGWIYSVAVTPSSQRHKIGTQLVQHAEANLSALGCPKINLQIAGGNEQVTGFYAALGYAVEPRVSMGKRLSENIPTK